MIVPPPLIMQAETEETTYHQCLFPQQYMEVPHQLLVLVKIAVGRAWLRLLPTPIPKLLNYPHEESQRGAQLVANNLGQLGISQTQA